MCSADIFLGVLAILFPPLPVWVKCGICSADSIINILLCCLGFLPGLVHAWYIIAKHPDPPYEYESLPQEGGRVTYVYVQSPPSHPGGMSYGTQGPKQSQSKSQSQQQQQQQQQQQHQIGTSAAGAGASHGEVGVPPSYADVVAGDHKVQTH
ncbi:hypothetical protein E4U49_002143 [Claviceps purpurea]|nr:hypothetical protein E4U49_002143 [Claviceps purpurea]